MYLYEFWKISITYIGQERNRVHVSDCQHEHNDKYLGENGGLIWKAKRVSQLFCLFSLQVLMILSNL